jgi:ArsR family transcriptional regulator
MITTYQLMQILNDATRLRVAVLMRSQGPLCVCELTAALAVAQPKMSRHLAAMRAAGVVEDCRVANRVFYRLAPDLPRWVGTVIDGLSEGIDGTGEGPALRRRLRALPAQPGRPDSEEQWRLGRDLTPPITARVR